MLEHIKFKNMDDDVITDLDFGLLREGSISKPHIFIIENTSNNVIRNLFLRPYRHYVSPREDTIMATRLSFNGLNYYTSLNFNLAANESKQIYVIWQPPYNASLGVHEWWLDLSINETSSGVFCP